MELKAVQEGEEERIIGFLRSTFCPEPERAGFLEPRQIRWKFFEPGPEWEGSRSYVLEEGGVIAAHGCAVPIVVNAGGTVIRAVQVIDWAGSPAFPGAGYLLLKEVRRLAGAGIGIGGSDVARAVIRKSQERDYGRMAYFARPLRPWAAFLAERNKTWKSPLRFLCNRGLAWRPLPPSRGWRLDPVERFDDDNPGLAGFQPRGFSPCVRSARFLNYMLRCPGAAFSGYLARSDGAVRGYAMLALVGLQARVAELAVASEDPADWAAVHALACQAARRLGAVEAVAAGSIPLVRQALERNGYREYRATAPVTCWDPSGVLSGAPPPLLSLLDGDASYLS
jgi:hypothetical protein